MMHARVRAGDLVLKFAGVMAALGRALLGKPHGTLSGDHAKGCETLGFSDPVPPIVRGLRLIGPEVDEVVMAREVRGAQVRIDRPIAQDYPSGTVVKLLV